MRLYDDGEHIISTCKDYKVKLWDRQPFVWFVLQGPSQTDFEVLCNVRCSVEHAVHIYKLAGMMIPDGQSILKRSAVAGLKQMCTLSDKLRSSGRDVETF